MMVKAKDNENPFLIWYFSLFKSNLHDALMMRISRLNSVNYWEFVWQKSVEISFELRKSCKFIQLTFS